MDSIHSTSLIYFTNNGIFGYNAARQEGGVIWPKYSANQYIFGGGVWFVGQKANPSTGQMENYAEVSYNPISGNSWFTPGRYEENRVYDYEMNLKYKPLKSSGFDKKTGKSKIGSYSWPLWKNIEIPEAEAFGHFVYDNSLRNLLNYPSGPKYFSDENIFITFNDLEVEYFEYDQDVIKLKGYPLGLQFEQNIYTWTSGVMKNCIVVSYKIINISDDEIKNCYAAPVIDYDIAKMPYLTDGAKNDRGRFYSEDPSLGLGIGWSNTDFREEGFGYIGFSLLQTPAVDENHYIRKDKSFFNQDEQIGLHTFRNVNINEDFEKDDELYASMTSGIFEKDRGSGDKRALLSTGPFNLRPGDTARVTLLINFAEAAINSSPDGTTSDLDNLIDSKKEADKFWQKIITGIAEHDIYDINMLGEVSPNPVKDVININFSLSSPGKISIELYDVLGNKLEDIISNGYFSSGEHNYIHNISHLAPSVYMLIMKDNDKVQAQKFVVKK